MSVELFERRSCMGHRNPLGGDQWAEVPSHQIALAGKAQAGQPAGYGKLKAELTQADDQLESAEIVGGVLAVAVRMPCWRR